MKLSKHHRSKQRCQDLGWKVHDGAQSFVLCSYTMHELSKILLHANFLIKLFLECDVHLIRAHLLTSLHLRIYLAHPTVSVTAAESAKRFKCS